MRAKSDLYKGVSRSVTRRLVTAIILTAVGLYCLDTFTFPVIVVIPFPVYIVAFIGGLVSAIVYATALLVVTTGRRATGSNTGSFRKLNRSDLSESKSKLARRLYYGGMVSALICLAPIAMFASVFVSPLYFIGLLCGPLGVILGTSVLRKITLEQRERERDMRVYSPLTVFIMWLLVIVGIIGTAIATPIVGASIRMTGDIGGVGYDPGSSMMAVVAAGILYIFPAFLLALKKRWAWILAAFIMLAELTGFSLFYANGFFKIEPLSSKYSFGFVLYLVPIVLVLIDVMRHRNIRLGLDSNQGVCP